MRSGMELLTATLETGAVASAATTAAIAACAKAEGTTVAGPLNAVSHILYGDQAARRDDVTLKHTATGTALNAAAVTMWAGIYEALFGRRAERDPATALVGGATVAVMAYATDYYVVPQRLTPGFEKRLSNTSLFAIYGVLAGSFALGSLLRRR